MFRALFSALVLGLCLIVVPSQAWAGSYLNRAAVLLDGAAAERDMVRPRVQDKELVELVREIAEARVTSAGRMNVPAAVATAHPHLLLALENTERAYAAVLAGHLDKFILHLDRARAEDATFRALMVERGYTMPGGAPPK